MSQNTKLAILFLRGFFTVNNFFHEIKGEGGRCSARLGNLYIPGGGATLSMIEESFSKRQRVFPALLSC